jgi:hypothetical protein
MKQQDLELGVIPVARFAINPLKSRWPDPVFHEFEAALLAGIGLRERISLSRFYKKIGQVKTRVVDQTGSTAQAAVHPGYPGEGRPGAGTGLKICAKKRKPQVLSLSTPDIETT